MSGSSPESNGRVMIRYGDDVLVAEAGDYVCQPKGVPHTFFVLDDQPAVILQTHDRDSFLNFMTGRERSAC